MQHSSAGFRGGVRIGHHYVRSRHGHNNDEDSSFLSNSNSDEKDDTNMDVKQESTVSSTGINSDFELAIRNLRPSATKRRTTKSNLNISRQKADLPQLNTTNEDVQNHSLSEPTENSGPDQQQNQWFPKADVGLVDSNAFIRHNHVDTEPSTDTAKQSTSPSALTKLPPIDVDVRPTATVASCVDPAKSAVTLFSSSSSVRKAASNNCNSLDENVATKIGDEQQVKSLSTSSAFQPIKSTQSALQTQPPVKSAPVLMDIPQHKALERGQKLSKVHISHPQSPSIVHLMLNDDFNTACRLLREMAAHPELQADHSPSQPFKAQVNRLCACFHEGHWFRCRILQISADCSTATVVYLDWGMMIPTRIGPEYIRRLPNAFYAEPACSIMCHLDGVPDIVESVPSDVITQCIALLSEKEYDVIVNDYESKTGGKILLLFNGRIVNDQLSQLLMPNALMTPDEEEAEQFRHQVPLTVGEELKALLSSFSGKDDSFYVLLVNESTAAIDRVMHQLQETKPSDGRTRETPRVKTLVVARYADDGKWYRAWVKSVCSQRQQATVFFVDFGNDSTVMFSDICPCPESVRSLPWFGIRVRLTDEAMAYDELVTMWKVADSHYIWIKVLEVLKDSYSVQLKVDYSLLLRQERMKSVPSNRIAHIGVQAMIDNGSSARCSSKISMTNKCPVTSSVTDQSQVVNENLIRNLFDVISNELRRLRHRLNDSDEASRDRHSQVMQLLFSTFNLNNSNNPKRL